MSHHRRGWKTQARTKPTRDHRAQDRVWGGVLGYAYTKANQDKGITWNSETLDIYLTNPKMHIPGTKMVFAGLKKKKDRKNLITYINEAATS